MIQKRTIIKISDNSGAKSVRCIQVLGGFKKRYAKIGDIVVVSIQELRNKSKFALKVKKKEVYKALITKTKKSYKKNTGLEIRFEENSAILLNNQGNSIGTRTIGPFLRLFKKKKFQKFNSIANGLL